MDVRIKEEDKCKAAFLMLKDVCEPMVMFFGLTNSLVTCQAMMNNLLIDIIETGDIAAFIDNVVVGTEIEEKHSDIVEKVLRRMAENDLFVKPEKCM